MTINTARERSLYFPTSTASVPYPSQAVATCNGRRLGLMLCARSMLKQTEYLESTLEFEDHHRKSLAALDSALTLT